MQHTGHPTTPPDPNRNHTHVIRRTAPPEARIVRVAGVTFTPGYPDNLHRLHRHTVEAAHGETPAIILRPNPANEHDRNAIEVHAPALGDNGMIGHIPARLAARLAPLAADGATLHADLFAVAIDAAHPDRPGCEIRIWATK